MTPEQIADFRADIGDTNEAFADWEIERLYERAGNNYDRALLLGLDQLIASATKFTEYTQNASQEKKNQIFEHLLKLREILAKRAAGGNAIIVGTRVVPKRQRNKPHDSDHNALLPGVDL